VVRHAAGRVGIGIVVLLAVAVEIVGEESLQCLPRRGIPSLVARGRHSMVDRELAESSVIGTRPSPQVGPGGRGPALANGLPHAGLAQGKLPQWFLKWKIE